MPSEPDKKESACYMAYKMSPKKKLEFDPSEPAPTSSGATSSPSSFSLVEATLSSSIGQREGLTYHEVVFKYPGYYQWGTHISHPSKCLADFLTWVTTYYEASESGDVAL